MELKFLLLISIFVSPLESRIAIRISNVKCGSSEKSANKFFCVLKSYNRRFPVLDAGFTILRKILEGRVGKTYFVFESFEVSHVVWHF